MNVTNIVQLETFLKELGLTEKEAKIYLTLLQLQEALPNSISRRSGVKRPTTYVILEQLKKKGLVSFSKRKDRTYFRPIDPKFLLNEYQKKCQKLEHLLPELKSLGRIDAVTPQMSVFEGREGIIQIMEDTLTSSTELCCWCNGDLALKSLNDYYPEYLKRKVERGLWLRGVFTYDQASLLDKRRGKQELREVYLIPKERYPFTNEINIYDDKVAIISHEDETGVIIQNEHIANTQRAIFQLTFDYAKILELSLLTNEDKAYIADGTSDEEGSEH